MSTGHKQALELKGKDVELIDSYVRIFIIGNEDWGAPATMDERWLAVFDVDDTYAYVNNTWPRRT